jgi:hypothetical protein
VFLVDVSREGRLERLRLLPVRLDFALVNLAEEGEREEICRRMVERSARLGTTLRPSDVGLELVLQPG